MAASRDTLDLHGVHAWNSVFEVNDYIYNEVHKRPYGQEFQKNFITGRGRHSRGGVPVLKPIVKDFLEAVDLPHRFINPGCIQATLRGRKMQAPEVKKMLSFVQSIILINLFSEIKLSKSIFVPFGTAFAREIFLISLFSYQAFLTY